MKETMLVDTSGAVPIGAPPPTSDEFWPTRGEWLHLEHYVPPAPPPLVVVFAHGFSPYAAPYRHVARALVGAGFAVTMYDARGHGHSTGLRGYVRHFSDYVADLRRVVARARSFYPGVPFALVGHSQGGAVVLDYVLSKRSLSAPLVPSCVVAAAPMLKITLPIPWFERLVVPVGSALLPRVQVSNRITPEMITRNAFVRRAFWRDPLVHHVATPRWFTEVDRTTTRLRASASKLSVPTLMMTAGADRLVSIEAQDDFVKAAPAHLIAQKHYRALFHELFLEPERDTVLAQMVSWLEERVEAEQGRRGERAPEASPVVRAP